MVSRQDIRDINEEVQELIEAIDELEDLHDTAQKDGVNVDQAAFAEAQDQMKSAVTAIVEYSNDMVDRTDRLENDDGMELESLPDAAADRTDLPLE